MPLYDFQCDACGQTSTLLLKPLASATCPHCQSTKMTKQFSTFAITHGSRGAPSTSSAPETRPGSDSSGHIHTAACAGRCGAGAKAEALIKKHLG